MIKRVIAFFGSVASVLPAVRTGLSLLMNPWILLALVAALAAGARVGSSYEAGQQAKRDVRAAQQAVEKMDGYRVANAALAEQLALEQVGREEDRRKLQGEIRARTRSGGVLTAVCSKPSPAAAPSGAVPEPGATRVRCDGDCVRLWNSALAVGLPVAYRGWDADAARSAADSVEGDELIENAADNFEACNVARGIALGWQQWAVKQGLWRGPSP